MLNLLQGLRHWFPLEGPDRGRDLLSHALIKDGTNAPDWSSRDAKTALRVPLFDDANSESMQASFRPFIATPFEFSVWANLDDFSPVNRQTLVAILQGGSGAEQNIYALCERASATGFSLVARGESGSTAEQLCGGGLSTGVWYLVSGIIWSASKRDAALDGLVQSTATTTKNVNEALVTRIDVGFQSETSIPGPGNYLSGKVCDLQIRSPPLSERERVDLYKLGPLGLLTFFPEFERPFLIQAAAGGGGGEEAIYVSTYYQQNFLES